MNKDIKLKILDKLQDDNHYYGDFGKQFISNSDVRNLILYPDLFKKQGDETVAMLQGRYFHTAILEPDKLKNFTVVEASTRNTKIYKSAVEEAQEMLLLKGEVDNLSLMIQSLNSKDELYNTIKSATAYEQPQITEIEGLWFKGKADIVHDDLELVIDLKTTSDLDKFTRSCNTYYYDSQAFIYRELFGYDVRFVVVDKRSLRVGVFDTSEEMYERGRNRVLKAIEQYNKFYGENAEFDVHEYYHYEII